VYLKYYKFHNTNNIYFQVMMDPCIIREEEYSRHSHLHDDPCFFHVSRESTFSTTYSDDSSSSSGDGESTTSSLASFGARMSIGDRIPGPCCDITRVPKMASPPNSPTGDEFLEIGLLEIVLTNPNGAETPLLRVNPDHFMRKKSPKSPLRRAFNGFPNIEANRDSTITGAAPKSPLRRALHGIAKMMDIKDLKDPFSFLKNDGDIYSEVKRSKSNGSGSSKTRSLKTERDLRMQKMYRSRNLLQA